MPPESTPYLTWDNPEFTGPSGPAERIAVIGYGNQGRAQALNLRDSGLPVVVGLREGSKSEALAKADGFDVVALDIAAATSTAIIILIPDEYIHRAAAIIQEHVASGSILILAHGSSIHFEYWFPSKDLDCGLIAPHGPGLELRRLYEAGSGIPAILAEVQDATGRCRKRLETISAGLGCNRAGAGIRWSTLREEVETDLFVEQALLVGGVIELLRAVVATMVRAGYDPAIVRMSTVYELPHIANVYEKLGPVEAFKAISPTAAFGAATRGIRLMDEHSRRVLEDMLEEIRNGSFVDELVSPQAPLILQSYIDGLDESNLSIADRPFHKKDKE